MLGYMCNIKIASDTLMPAVHEKVKKNSFCKPFFLLIDLFPEHKAVWADQPYPPNSYKHSPHVLPSLLTTLEAVTNNGGPLAHKMGKK